MNATTGYLVWSSLCAGWAGHEAWQDPSIGGTNSRTLGAVAHATVGFVFSPLVPFIILGCGVARLLRRKEAQ